MFSVTEMNNGSEKRSTILPKKKGVGLSLKRDKNKGHTKGSENYTFNVYIKIWEDVL